MEDLDLLQIKKPVDYLLADLTYNVIQLNQYLTKELESLEEKKDSTISDRIIRLAESTAILTRILVVQNSDLNAIVKNTMS